jgi:hypothetical protein
VSIAKRAPAAKPQQLFEVPAGTPALTAMDDKKAEGNIVDHLMYCLVAPLLTWPGYEDDLREKLSDVKLDRLVHHAEIAKGLCTEYEAMLYLSTASLANPPTEMWTNLYLWLFWRWVKDKEGAEANGLKPHREPGAYELQELERFRRWVYKTQMEHVRRKTKAAAAANDPEPKGPPTVGVEHPRLF